MKKWYKKLIIATSIVSSTMIFPTIVLSAKTEKNNDYDFIINSELARVNRFDNNLHIVNFSNVITDLNGHKVLLISFDNMYSIVEIKNLITLETNWEDISQLSQKNNLFYVTTIGIVEKINSNQYKSVLSGEIYDYSNIKDFVLKLNFSRSADIKNEEIEKRESEIKSLTSSEITSEPKKLPYTIVNDAYIWRGSKEMFGSTPNISNLTEHAWWWLTRDTKAKIGYDLPREDEYPNVDKSSGWCCYHALANLLLYNELFKYPALFSDSEYKSYITYDSNPENKILYTSPIFKWNKFNDHPKNEEDRRTFAYFLHKLNNKNYHNFHGGNAGVSFNELYQKFVNNKEVKNKYQTFYSDNWNNSFRNAYKTIINDKLPVILTTADVDEEKYTRFNHAFVAYGYDKDTNQFLITNLWGGKRTSACLLSYYLMADYYSYFAIKPLSFSKTSDYFKPYFLYKGKRYNWQRIEDYIFYDQSANV
ncbi:putative cysteine peptidase [Mycoplasma hafezii]|uniref:putative cysteine peptidase n=1 Tax=Mycoplasma hafezii TaxID=525886 RepID=UPI003CF08CF7